jgi:hypothetical protein
MASIDLFIFFSAFWPVASLSLIFDRVLSLRLVRSVKEAVFSFGEPWNFAIMLEMFFSGSPYHNCLKRGWWWRR